jgi:hypothetical protein
MTAIDEASVQDVQPGTTGILYEWILESIRKCPDYLNCYGLDCGICESSGLCEWLYADETPTEYRDLINDCIAIAVQTTFCRAVAQLVSERLPLKGWCNLEDLAQEFIKEDIGYSASDCIERLEKIFKPLLQH